MIDVFTREKRSAIMRAIRGKDTQPECAVRRLVHRLGYRYRLHARDLPGCPDLVFPRRRKVIFIHGCFWHRHNCRKGRSMPRTRSRFWREKLEANKRRDSAYRRALNRKGWSVLTIWQCQITSARFDRLAMRLARFLNG